MQVRIPAEHEDAMRLLAAKNRRSVAAETAEAIKNHLHTHRAELRRGPKLAKP